MRDTYPLKLGTRRHKQYKQGLKRFVIKIVDSEAATMHRYYGYRNTMIFTVHCVNIRLRWYGDIENKFLVVKETVVLCQWEGETQKFDFIKRSVPQFTHSLKCHYSKSVTLW